MVLENLTREQVRDWRVRAMKDHQVAVDHIDQYTTWGQGGVAARGRSL
ncbi:hypothetical protein ACGFXB_44245 [Streptomyces canus]